MKKLVKMIRIVLSIALVIGWYQIMQALIDFHYTCCPELYGTAANKTLLFLPLIVLLLMMPFPIAAITAASGYKLHRLHWLFLVITKPDKLRIRLNKKLGFSLRMLPPRTDGTSPYVLYWCSAYVIIAALFVISALLAAIFWRTPASRYLNNYFLGTGLWVFLLPLLPTKGNAINRVLAFRRSQDLRRAWECSMHTAAAMDQGMELTEMPEEWFLPYPEKIQDHPLVRLNNFNHAARLIDQERPLEGYECLRYFFDLTPAPDTYQLIAGAILNGAIVEALNDLPPMCLSQLEHASLKLPLPPQWERGLLTARYACALFVHHDENEAAAILPELEKMIEKEGKGHETLERLQKKAGIGGTEA